MVTDFTYDVLGRVEIETRQGVSASGTLQAQPATVTTYAYDAADRVLSVTKTAGGLSTVTSSTYDLAGRVTSTTDETGLVTLHGQADVSVAPPASLPSSTTAVKQTKLTTTRPGNVTEISYTTGDGWLTKLEGTGVIPTGYERTFDAASGTFTTKDFVLDTPARWSSRVEDLSGKLHGHLRLCAQQ